MVMKGSRKKMVLLVLLMMASVSSFVYLNANKLTYNAPKLSQPTVEDFRQDQVRLPDVHVFEAATEVIRKIIPGS